MSLQESPLDEELWSNRLADVLIDAASSKVPLTVTWLNHYSALQARKSRLDYSEFDLVGIDGILLRRIAATTSFPRTSADLVLPLVLAKSASLRIGFLGGTPSQAHMAAATIRSQLLADTNELVYIRDGYGALPSSTELEADAGPLDLLILGLGAPKQDEYALALSKGDNRPNLIVTCGGWLDQVSHPAYYPDWAYKLQLNWAVRLTREPARLWKRYTIDAARAISSRSNTKDWMSRLPGIEEYEQKLLESV